MSIINQRISIIEFEITTKPHKKVIIQINLITEFEITTKSHKKIITNIPLPKTVLKSDGKKYILEVHHS